MPIVLNPKNLSEKGSDPLRRGKKTPEIDSPRKGQTPFPIGSKVKPMRALVVDDSRTARRLVRGMMQRLGFRVSEAENGLQALDTIEREGAPEIALVDWNMPKMDGMQFARAVRARPEFDSMLLMMVTT